MVLSKATAVEVGEPSPGGIDRREHHRARYFAEVEIQWGDTTLQAHTGDISLDGMLIEMRNPLWSGAEFLARLLLAQEAPLELACVVKRVVPGVGMGVAFTDVRPSDQTRLRRLIATLPH